MAFSARWGNLPVSQTLPLVPSRIGACAPQRSGNGFPASAGSTCAVTQTGVTA